MGPWLFTQRILRHAYSVGGWVALGEGRHSDSTVIMVLVIQVQIQGEELWDKPNPTALTHTKDASPAFDFLSYQSNHDLSSDSTS